MTRSGEPGDGHARFGIEPCQSPEERWPFRPLHGSPCHTTAYRRASTSVSQASCASCLTSRSRKTHGAPGVSGHGRSAEARPFLRLEPTAHCQRIGHQAGQAGEVADVSLVVPVIRPGRTRFENKGADEIQKMTSPLQSPVCRCSLNGLT